MYSSKMYFCYLYNSNYQLEYFIRSNYRNKVLR